MQIKLPIAINTSTYYTSYLNVAHNSLLKLKFFSYLSGNIMNNQNIIHHLNAKEECRFCDYLALNGKQTVLNTPWLLEKQYASI